MVDMESALIRLDQLQCEFDMGDKELQMMRNEKELLESRLAKDTAILREQGAQAEKKVSELEHKLRISCEEVAALHAEKESLGTRLHEIQSSLGDVFHEMKAAATNIRDLERQLGASQEEIQGLQDDKEAAQLRIQALEAEILEITQRSKESDRAVELISEERSSFENIPTKLRETIGRSSRAPAELKVKSHLFGAERDSAKLELEQQQELAEAEARSANADDSTSQGPVMAASVPKQIDSSIELPGHPEDPAVSFSSAVGHKVDISAGGQFVSSNEEPRSLGALARADLSRNLLLDAHATSEGDSSIPGESPHSSDLASYDAVSWVAHDFKMLSTDVHTSTKDSDGAGIFNTAGVPDGEGEAIRLVPDVHLARSTMLTSPSRHSHSQSTSSYAKTSVESIDSQATPHRDGVAGEIPAEGPDPWIHHMESPSEDPIEKILASVHFENGRCFRTEDLEAS